MFIMKIVTHLLDTNNNKTYCGLKHLNVLSLISDLDENHDDVNCINCLKVVDSINKKVLRS